MTDTTPAATARPTRRLVLAVLALLGAVLVLMGGQGTFAFWTDEASVSTGNFTSGKLDLKVDGKQGNATEPDVRADLALDRMVPGESVAQIIKVSNVGDADLTWVPQVTKTGVLDPVLVVEMSVGASLTPAGTAYPRRGSCTGGTAIGAAGTSSRLNKGATQDLCVKVTFKTDAADAMQGQTTGSVSIALAATQLIP